VGTRFGVDRLGDAVEVRVYEGTVKVEAKGSDPRAVTSGQWLLIDPKRGVTAGTFAPEAYPNWRTGWLEADAMPLGFVVARLNRYTDNKIVLADDKLAAVTLSGRFRLDNPAGTLKQIAALLDVRVTAQDHRILLTPKP
jgi:transmembrane sensor